MLGRSMGGGVTMNALVTQPGLVDAAVIYASVSSRFLDNLEHFTRPGRPEVVDALFDQFGTPAEAPTVLPRAVAAHVLRPDHRAGAGPPRHRRRDLPAAVGADHAAA